MLEKTKCIGLKEKQQSGLDMLVNNSRGFSYYLCGFADGEGCFSVSYRMSKKIRVGIEITPSFSLAQKKGAESHHLLSAIRDFLGGGGIRDDGRGCYKYETRNLDLICNKIIPFFSKYRLVSAKQNDFVIFSTICSRMSRKQHLSFKGLLSILESSRPLNPSNTSLEFLIAKLRTRMRKDEF